MEDSQLMYFITYSYHYMFAFMTEAVIARDKAYSITEWTALILVSIRGFLASFLISAKCPSISHNYSVKHGLAFRLYRTVYIHV